MIHDFCDRIIFMISQPRAGSTLFQLMLAGHPEVATTAETWLALHPSYILRREGVEAEYDAFLAPLAIRDFLESIQLDEKGFWDVWSRSLLDLYQLAAQRLGGSYFLDKGPRYYFVLPELRAMFPEAKFIILFRNPVAVFRSVIRSFGEKDAVRLRRHKDDLLLAPGLLLDFAETHRDSILRVAYEDLVRDPETIMRGAAEFLRLPFEPSMLEYAGRRPDSWRFGDQFGIKERTRPDPALAEQWKKLHPKDAALARIYLEQLGRQTIARMSYDYEEIDGALAELAARDAPGDGDAGGHSWAELFEGDVDWSRPKGSEGQAVTKDQEIKQLRERVERVEGSLSWKITAPLRDAYRTWRRRGTTHDR